MHKITHNRPHNKHRQKKITYKHIQSGIILSPNTKSNQKYVSKTKQPLCSVTNRRTRLPQRLWKTIGTSPLTPRRHVARSASRDCVHITGELPATMEIDKTVSRKIYIEDSRHNLLGFDFIKSLGLLDIPLNSVCNAIFRSPAKSAITKQTDDTLKRFPPIFTNNARRCTQAETIPILKLSATLIFRPQRLQRLWSRIHVDFAGPSNGCSFLLVVDAHYKWLEIFPVQNTDTRSTIAVLKRLFSQHGLPETFVSGNDSQFTSETFQHFSSSCCITHVRSPPNHQ